MVLNSLAVDPRIIWKGGWRWYEDSMLNCTIDMESVKATGISLPTFMCLANCQGLQSERYLASESSVEEFRAAVKEVCIERVDNFDPSLPLIEDEAESGCSSKCCDKEQDSRKFLVVTYNRGTLNQTGSGHFSPIAAYDPISDKVLILDTARFKYGPHWVSLPLMFDAMIPCDPSTSQSRGYILLSFEEAPDCCQRVLPQSILFRSEMSNYAARQRYKIFLSTYEPVLPDGSNSITLEDVHDFMSQNGTNCASVWDMISPQLIPIDLTDKENVDSLLSLLQSLTQGDIKEIKSELRHDTEHECTLGEFSKLKATNRMIHVRSTDMTYIIYLASLPPIEHKK